MYRLYHELAHRYDLHTPPGHYRDDHAFVLEQARRVSPSCRLLDVGCGSGVFLEAAVDAGLDGHGFDSSPEMVAVARRRVGAERVWVQRMQELSEEATYDLVCSLSWPIHYCATVEELSDVLRRCRRSLRPGGVIVLQVANDERMTGAVNVDKEPGPRGEAGDTLLIHRFRPIGGPEHRVIAEYVYASQIHDELLCEEHELRFANPLLVVEFMREAGFINIDVIQSASVSPFVVGTTE